MRHHTALIAAALIAAPATAQTWDGATSTNWGIGTNWNPNGVPTIADTATINNGALTNQPVIESGDSFTLQGVDISAGVLDISGDLTANTVTVSGTGQLRVRTGGSVTGSVSSRFTELGGGTINGNVTNTGELRGRGTITGTLSGSSSAQTIAVAQLSVGRLDGTSVVINAGGLFTPLAGQLHTASNLDRRGGTLDLRQASLTVAGDYQNAGFGSGSAFNARAGTVGTGQILALSAIQTLSATGLTGGTTSAATLDLGVIRVGSPASRTVTINNLGTQTTLRGVVHHDGTPGHSLSGATSFAIAAGGSAQLTVQYAYAAAGIIPLSTLTVANNFDNVADQTLSVTGIVNNLAAPAILQRGSEIAFDSGLASHVIDLGRIRIGSVVTLSDLQVANLASGPADDLSGSFDTTTSSIFSLASPFTLARLGAGQASSPFTLLVDTGAKGIFQGRFTLLGLGTNASDLTGIAANTALTLRASIFVPEPGTWAMLITGFGLIGTSLRRRRAWA